MKRLIVFLLALALTLTMALPVMASEQTGPPSILSAVLADPSATSYSAKEVTKEAATIDMDALVVSTLFAALAAFVVWVSYLVVKYLGEDQKSVVKDQAFELLAA